VRAIVFDLDGLMVDSEPLARRAWETVLAPLGILLDDDLYGRMIGLRVDESSRLLCEHYGLPALPDEVTRRRRAEFDALAAQGIPTMPGLEELLAAVRARRLPWAVATSSRRAYALGVLGSLGLGDQVLAAGDEVPHGKPAPDVYLLAAARLGLEPAACLALEDSVPGAVAARSAGMRVAAVPGRQAHPAEFPFADYVFSSLSEVARSLDAVMRDA
jgi:HAD superfamily hydrolase (TIGR01509 family)